MFDLERRQFTETLGVVSANDMGMVRGAPAVYSFKNPAPAISGGNVGMHMVAMRSDASLMRGGASMSNDHV